MKRITFIVLAVVFALSMSCNKDPKVKNPIKVSSPSPTEQISKVTLDATQQGYVEAGNGMAFRFLEEMYEGDNLILSPLSLQYALAMTANGASGETLQEIIDFLGYGSEGVDALNAYCKTMLEQLPAVDLDVTLKLTDALIVNDQFPLRPEFQKTVQDSYYAAVQNMDFTNPDQVAATINEWAKRSTNGFIDKILQKSDISADAVAFIMNALYFKAKWAGSEWKPMFVDDATRDETFNLSDGTTRDIPMMNCMHKLQYAEMEGYRVLALPYAGSKFFMYILLPDENNLDALVKKLPSISWKDVRSNFKQDAEVYVKLPKFDVENKFDLTESLKKLGVQKAFVQGDAEFESMFKPKEQPYDYWISKVFQKARIAVDEWGTEAAAVTVEVMAAATSALQPDPKRVYFYADHPFIFLIGEASSGTILFEGTFTGK